MTRTAIQQFQLRKHFSSQGHAQETLRAIEEMGFDGIELNGFMIRKLPWTIRLLTQMAGMGIGASGNLNWEQLLSGTSLKVVALHENLGHILENPRDIVAEAKVLGTKNIVITGMRKFDYSDEKAVLELANQLNTAGHQLAEQGLSLSYHNHNCEFQKVNEVQTAFDLLLEKTDEKWLNFEVDAFWAVEAGVDIIQLLKKVGHRQSFLHLTDRGCRPKGKIGSILKSDCLELGTGNMNLNGILHQSKQNRVDSLIIETHRNWINQSALDSARLSIEYLNKIM